LLTCSHALIEKASGYVTDLGGVPVCRPLIELVATFEAREHLERIDEYDWVVLTSPSAVRCFGALLREAHVDLRRVPKLVTCGGGTSAELEQFGLKADIEPDAHFSAQGMMMIVSELVTPETRVLRLRSDKAGSALADAMREQGAAVEDVILYNNEPVAYDSAPAFDSVFFASASAVEVFIDLWGTELLESTTVVAIGIPTVAALENQGVTVDVVGREATVGGAMEELARQMVRKAL
jgi:uroporphyrinogen-III synthase